MEVNRCKDWFVEVQNELSRWEEWGETYANAMFEAGVCVGLSAVGRDIDSALALSNVLRRLVWFGIGPRRFEARQP